MGYVEWITVRSPRFLLLISIFVTLSVLVTIGATSGLDDLVLSTIRSLHRNDALDIIIANLSLLGDTSTLLLLAVVIAVLKRTRRAGIVFLTSILIIIILATYIKVFVGRDAPPIIIPPSLNASQDQMIEEETVSPQAKKLSYPASQIAIVACLGYMAELTPLHKSKFVASLIWSYPMLMAFSRLFMMQYYLTDVIGGFLLGLIIGTAMSSIMRLNPRGK